VFALIDLLEMSAISCSAGWSRDCGMWRIGNPMDVRIFGCLADCQSATRQVANLRYGSGA